MSLRRLASHAELLEATGSSPFIRYDIPAPLEHPAWALGTAVALPRQTHTRRLGLLVMGPPDDAGRLSWTQAGVPRRDGENLMVRCIGNLTVTLATSARGVLTPGFHHD